jgi:hypothetical protein
MRYTWDEAKRIANLRDHGIDFVDAEKVFAGLTLTYEDDRFRYGERRFVTLGLLAGIPVSVAHNEEDDRIHVISEKRLNMRQHSSSRRSRTNYRRLRSLADKDIRVTPEHPEADLRHIARGIVRRGLKVAGPKELVSLRIDADVLNWFKASGSGYQTRINAVLRAYKDAAAG